MVLRTKKPFIHIRDEEFSPRYHPDSFDKQTLFVAITGIPGADYLIHQHSLSCEITGEFGLFVEVPRRHCVGLPPHSPNSLTG